MRPQDTLRQLTRSGLALARRPLVVAAYATGLVKGTVEGTLHVTGSLASAVLRSPRDTRPPVAGPGEESGHIGERTRYGGLNTEAAPPMSPGGGGEPIEHEPTAESRDVAHGDAAVQPREVESWAEEVNDAEPEEADGADGEPLIDPGTAKAVRSESETLRRAADPDKG